MFPFNLRHTSLSIRIFIIAMLCGYAVFAQIEPYPYARGKIKHRLSVSYVYSAFKNHPQLTTENKVKPGFEACYKAEFFSGHKMNFTTGLTFLHQQFIFRGYYTAPGYTYVYDKTFPYTHNIQMQEVQLPIGIKGSLVDEKAFDFSPYFSGGVKFSYLLKNYAVIRNDSTGITVVDGKLPVFTFESNIPTPKIGTCLYAGLGIQHNNRANARATFLEIVFHYGISRLHYVGLNNSNNLNIRNNYITITLGHRI